MPLVQRYLIQEELSSESDTAKLEPAWRGPWYRMLDRRRYAQQKV